MNVLITDGENRSSLAATRSLSGKGHKIIVSGKKKQNISSASKYCIKAYKTKDPLRDGDDYIDNIVKIINKEKIDVVLPMSEPTIYLLNEYHHVIPKSAIIACPEQEKVNLIFDKYKLFKLAASCDVPIPATVFINNREELPAKEGQLPEFPLVVKPGMSRIRTKAGFLAAGVMYVHNLDELKTLYSHEEVLKYPSMIQEKIVGPGTGLFTLFDGKKHLALFSHKRLREKPPWGGVSVVCQSVSLDDKMVEASKKLLSAVGWRGVAMVEFKRDLRDGTAKLMEINGRFWGSLQLAISSGVDFPNLFIDYLVGKAPSEAVSSYKKGYKLKWILGTLDHLIIRLKNTHHELYNDQEYQSKRRAFLDFMRIKERDTCFDVFDSHDLKPFMLEVKEYTKDILSKII